MLPLYHIYYTAGGWGKVPSKVLEINNMLLFFCKLKWYKIKEKETLIRLKPNKLTNVYERSAYCDGLIQQKES